MARILLAAPAVEPVPLAEVKALLALDHATDDVILGALVVAARRHVEAVTRRMLIRQRWRLIIDAWPHNGRLAVPFDPLAAVVAVRLVDAAGTSTPFDHAHMRVLPGAPPVIDAGMRRPLAGRFSGGIEIDCDVGFGPAPADVPADLRQAIRLLAAHWYEHRGGVAAGAGAGLPAPVAALLAPWRGARL